MSGPIHQIDPGKYILAVGATPSPISGYAKGTMIEVSRDVNAWEKVVGGDGEVSRVHSRNRAGSIKITLLQGSASNAVLSALAALDEATGQGVVPIAFMDMSSQAPFTEASAPNGWIRKMADAKFGGEADEPREWIFDLDDVEYFLSGN